MTDLSPAAQAVLDAMHRSYDHEPTRRAIAAEVLQAAADQMGCYQSKKFLYSIADAMKLRNIAAELEAFSNE